jgi:myo-inositol-1(or 4)-monophosphatase
MTATTLDDDLDRRLGVAREVIREAGQMAVDYFNRRESLAITRKGAQDLVSEADRRCEELIVSRLSAAFPCDGFLGEEGGAHDLDAEAIWVIDPIDGTHNFLTGIPFWCLSIGLVVNGEAVIGVIYHPANEELFSARHGRGAFLNEAPIRVSGETDVKRARIGVGFSFRRPVTEHVRAIERLLCAGCEYLRLGSGALALAYAATGRFDGYWERHINAWDVAAGLVLVREAGGWTSDFFTGNGLARGNEVLAATPALVEPLSRLTLFGAR